MPCCLHDTGLEVEIGRAIGSAECVNVSLLTA